MNLKNIDESTIRTLYEQRDISKIIAIMLWDDRNTEADYRLRFTAAEAVVGFGADAVPPLEKAVNKWIDKKGFSDQVSFLMKALADLGRSDFVSEALYNHLTVKGLTFSLMDRKGISMFFDIILGFPPEYIRPDPFIAFLYANHFAYQNNKKLRERALKALKGLELKDDIQRFIAAISLFGEFRNLFEALGWTRESMTKPASLAEPSGFAKEFNRFLAKLDAEAADENTKAFLIRFLKDSFRSVFRVTSCVYVSLPSLFPIKEYSIQTPDLNYSLPGGCAGCLDTGALKKKPVTSTLQEIAGIRRTITLEFGFCRKCAKYADTFVSSINSLEFTNPAYGYLFAAMNGVSDYRLGVAETERVTKARKILARQGKEAAIIGIPEEVAHELEILREVDQ